MRTDESLNDRKPLRFKLHRIKADWLRHENDCISAMSALRMTTWKSGGNVRNRLASNNLETREISDYRTSLLDSLISFINAKGIYYIYNHSYSEHFV